MLFIEGRITAFPALAVAISGNRRLSAASADGMCCPIEAVYDRWLAIQTARIAIDALHGTMVALRGGTPALRDSTSVHRGKSHARNAESPVLPATIIERAE
jgi:hypothetical protein